jgi:hypothetical protein
MIRGRIVVVGLGPEEIRPERYSVPDPSNFAVVCFIRVGVSVSEATQDHRLIVCSPSWLVTRQPAGAILRGQGLLIMQRYDGEALHKSLCRFAEHCVANSVAKVFDKLSRLGFSEFEDYNEVGAPQYFIDESHEDTALTSLQPWHL